MKTTPLVIILLIGLGILGYIFLNKQNETDNLNINDNLSSFEEENEAPITPSNNTGAQTNTNTQTPPVTPPSTNPTPINPPVVQNGGQDIENYVTLVSGGGPNFPHQAIFQFNLPVQESDLIPSNIIFCVRSGSAAAQASGQSNENCDLLPSGSQSGVVNETSVSNGFSLSFNPVNMRITVSDINNSDPGMGSFYIGCASCTSNIKFTGINSVDGTLLPDKIIQVY